MQYMTTLFYIQRIDALDMKYLLYGHPFTLILSIKKPHRLGQGSVYFLRLAHSNRTITIGVIVPLENQ